MRFDPQKMRLTVNGQDVPLPNAPREFIKVRCGGCSETSWIPRDRKYRCAACGSREGYIVRLGNEGIRNLAHRRAPK